MHSNQHPHPATIKKSVAAIRDCQTEPHGHLLPGNLRDSLAAKQNNHSAPEAELGKAIKMPSISAARRALSLTGAITYSNGIPGRWTRCRLGWPGSMLGEAPLGAVSNGTADTKCMWMSVRGMRLPPAVPFLSRRGSYRGARTAPERPGPQPGSGR